MQVGDLVKNKRQALSMPPVGTLGVIVRLIGKPDPQPIVKWNGHAEECFCHRTMMELVNASR